jgi:MFS family permease
MFIHGKDKEAEELVSGIEQTVEEQTGESLETVDDTIEIQQRKSIGFLTIAKSVFTMYPKRTVLGLSLFAGQAFLYNAITFGYATILTTFYKVDAGSTGYYFVVIAIGNFLGPLLLGPLFDTVGRRVMISSTYLLSGILLFVTAWQFDAGNLSATSMTIWWTAVLFFASAGASSAYLTVSEIFPMETRAMAIAFFFAVGTALGGITGPLLFADLTSSGKVSDTVTAFVVGAVVMCAAGIVAIFLAVNAEQRSLEDIARPLTATSEPSPSDSAAAIRA